ncbi:endonuclease III [Rickettsiella grylli]|uniref:Endonuclease III n=1 Tax=Rickettsiella grylli TaxID=59196 RepID=A8PKX7_9COXI|nr:endonuclease III [Rickettsiella grylli]EDP46254.1 endonuclease III [Rickettsiella grylli]
MNQKKRDTIFQRFQTHNPHPTTELNYTSPFELLIAVILSAQATDKSVNNATQSLFSKANSPKKIVALGLSGLKKYIKTIGLYNTKAKNILKTCKILLANYQGHVPHHREALESLPGVGRKTANVILNTIFHQPTVAVDTHIFRVCNRTSLATGKTPLAVEKKLLQVVPQKYLKNAHHWLVLHGRYICLARKPKCPICIICDLCEYPHKTLLVK